MGARLIPFVAQPSLSGAILRHMKVEEIAEAVAKLPPDQLARFRRWFTAFEAGRTNHAEELDSPATKLGRLAGRAFAELKNARRNVGKCQSRTNAPQRLYSITSSARASSVGGISRPSALAVLRLITN
jgi:hypothetical protein